MGCVMRSDSCPLSMSVFCVTSIKQLPSARTSSVRDSVHVAHGVPRRHARISTPYPRTSTGSYLQHNHRSYAMERSAKNTQQQQYQQQQQRNRAQSQRSCRMGNEEASSAHDERTPPESDAPWTDQCTSGPANVPPIAHRRCNCFALGCLDVAPAVLMVAPT